MLMQLPIKLDHWENTLYRAIMYAIHIWFYGFLDDAQKLILGPIN